MKNLILIVDDVAENIQVLGKILSDDGYDIAVAQNGTDALEMVENVKPDLVLLDVMMPGMDGITVCRKLKEDEQHANLPVLFISAKSSTEDKLEGFNAGGADYIAKPFDSAEVLARVKTHLKLREAMAQVEQYNKNLEHLLRERTKSLITAERNAAFSLFSQGIVHNLKNPITIISNGVQLLEMKYEMLPLDDNSNPESISQLKEFIDYSSKYYKKFHNANNQMLNMLNNLMAKVRSDSEMDARVLNLNELLEQEIQFFNADLQFKHSTKKNIELTPEPLYVKVVPGEVNQIFQNLLRNALDAMYDQEDARIDIRTYRKETRACFSIRDNGPGIPPEVQENIFDPFFTTKPKAGSGDGPTGTGLGLYMVKSLVENYDGALTLNSEPGQGTEFIVSFPYVKPTYSIN